MPFTHDPLSDPLNDWLDQRATGRSTPDAGPAADPNLASLLAASRLMHGQHQRDGSALATATSIPPWERLMSSNHVSINPQLQSRSVPTAPSRWTPLARAVERWQPAVSFAVVLAVLIGLVGIAWNRNLLSEPGNEPANGFAAATPSLTVNGDKSCSAQEGTQATDEELRAMQYADWPAPSTDDPWPANSLSLEALDATFQSFYRCFVAYPPEPGKPLAPEITSYLSDRLRYTLLYDDLTPEQQGVLDEVFSRNPVPRLISTFPLPVNADWYNNSTISGELNEFLLVSVDLYYLPDQRIGGFVGNVSSILMQTGDPLRLGDGKLVWMAFVQQGDAWYIDEMYTICPSAFAPGALDQDAPIRSQPYDPAQFLSGTSSC